MRKFLKTYFVQNVHNTNLQLVFIKNFNQINRKQFGESLKERSRIALNTFFLGRDKLYRKKQTFFISQEKYILY